LTSGAQMNAQMLPPEELGKRLKLARTAAGLTQDAAANAMTLARTTLTAIENGQRKVKPDELVAFAKLYKTSVSRLVSAEAVHVDLAAQFRRVEEGADLGPDERHAIDLLTRMATASVELERIAGTPLRQDYPSPLQLRAGAVPAQAEDAAAALRHRLGVGLGPIADFASVLEFELGVRVFMRPLPSKVSGVYAYDPAVGACMLINASHPRVRRRNSLAHECAHFVASRTHADVFSEEDEHYVALEERFAKRFATSLLMPAPTVRRRFEDIAAAEGGFKLRHLIILRHAFGVATQSMCLRLEELDLVPEGQWESVKRRGYGPEFDAQVLGDPQPEERPPILAPRLANLVAIALEREALSEGQLCDMLALERTELRIVLDTVGALDGD
jgi:Zn-dependent peptidase ImmA (M78 family)/DNA-binding XRE family transcriptional regulator